MGIAHTVDLDWYIAGVPGNIITATQYQVSVAAASQVLDHHVRGETAVGSEVLSAPLVIGHIRQCWNTWLPCSGATSNTSGLGVNGTVVGNQLV